MNKKPKTLKKVAAGFVAVNVLASTVLTTIPFNVLAADAGLKVTSSEEANSGKTNVQASTGHVIKSEDLYIPDFTIMNGKVQNWVIGTGLNPGQWNFDDKRVGGLAVNPSFGYAISSNNVRNIQMTGGTNSNYGTVIGGVGVSTPINAVPNRTHQLKYSISGRMEQGNLSIAVGGYVNNTSTYIDTSKPYNVNQTNTATFKNNNSTPGLNFSLNRGTITFNILSYNLMYESQWNQIDALFGDPDHTTLGEGVTATTIAAAQKMKDAMGDGNQDKAEMQAELDKAWALVQFADTTISGQLLSTSTTIAGTGEPNQPIQIKKGSEVLASGKVGADGKYSFSIPAQPKGTVLEAVVNCYDRQEKKASTIVVKTIETTTINELSTTSKKVSGTAEPKTLVYIQDGEGTTIASGYSDASGNYSFPVANLQAGDTIIASVSVGDQTSSAQTVVKDDRKATTPSVQEVTDADTALNGTGTAGDTITVKIGDATYTGQVDADGNFTIPIPKQPGGTTIEVIETNPNNPSDPGASTKITVKDTTLVAPVISTVTTKDTSVKVTGEPGATIRLTLPNGTTMEKTADANGEAVFSIPAQAAGSTLSATQTGANGKASAPATVKIQQVSEGTLTVTAPYYVGYDTSVKAKVTGDIKKAYLIVDGVKYQTVSVNGDFSYYAKDKITSTSQNVQLVGLDANSHEVARVTVPLKDGSILKGTVSTDKYYVGADSYVKGTYTGAVQKVALSVNGQVSQKVAVLGDGKLQYYAKDKITAKTDNVQLIGYNSEGKEIARTTVPLGDASELTGSVTTDKFAISEDTYVTGTYQDNVKYVSLTINGQEYKRVQVLDNAKFQYYAKGLITQTTDSVQVNAYNSAGVKVDTETVQLIDSREKEGTLTPAAYTLEDTYIDGTYTGDIRYVALQVNGTTYGKVSVLDATNFRYYAKDKVKNVNDTVKVIGYNASGNIIDTKPVTIKEKPQAKGQIETVDAYELGSNYASGTYSGDIKKIALKVGDTTYSSVSVSADGTWKYYAKDKIKNTTTPVTVIGYNQNGEAVSEKAISVQEAAPAVVTFTVDPYTVIGGTGWLQGSYTGDITKIQLEVDGEKKSEIPVNSDGTWKYYAKDKITSTSQTAKMIAYSSQNKAVAEQTIILQ